MTGQMSVRPSALGLVLGAVGHFALRLRAMTIIKPNGILVTVSGSADRIENKQQTTTKIVVNQSESESETIKLRKYDSYQT
jgi:hypothetical protein